MDEIEEIEEVVEELNAQVEEAEEVEEDAPLSDEDLDKVADTAIEVLQGILSYFDVNGAEINEYEGEEGEIILDVVGGDLAVLIGRRGRTLDSLQLLVSTITTRKLGFHYPVTIDVESYKERQRQKLVSLANSAANRATRNDREVKLHPMNPYERRIVHMALRDDDRVETFSEGRDPDRYVIVRPL